STFRSRPTVNLAVALVAAATQLTISASAAAPSAATPQQHSAATFCSIGADSSNSCKQTADGLQIALPDGTQPCPASGEAAACALSSQTDLAAGIASTPDGMSVCSIDPNSPAAGTPAACNDSQTATSSTPADNPTVVPSVPISSLRPAAALQKLSLSASTTSTQAELNVILTAVTGVGVAGTGTAIEI